MRVVDAEITLLDHQEENDKLNSMMPSKDKGTDEDCGEMFDDIDADDSQLLMAENAVMHNNEMTSGGAIPGGPFTASGKPASNHIFHEMVVVRNRLDFDEQDFRERVHESSMQISQEFKEIVMELYDAVDKMVNDVSKKLHQAQTEQYQELDTKLSAIRRQAVEAETIDQSVKKFIGSVTQAFQQSFSNLDNIN